MKKILFVMMLVLTSILTWAADPYYEIIDGGFDEGTVTVKITYPTGTRIQLSDNSSSIDICYEDSEHTGISLATNKWVDPEIRDLLAQLGEPDETNGEITIVDNTVTVEFQTFSRMPESGYSPLKFFLSAYNFTINGKSQIISKIYRKEAQPYAKIIAGSPTSGNITVKATLPYASSISAHSAYSINLYSSVGLTSTTDISQVEMEGNEMTLTFNHFYHDLYSDDVTSLYMVVQPTTININEKVCAASINIPFVDANAVTPDQAFLNDEPEYNYFYIQNLEDTDMEMGFVQYSYARLEYTTTPDVEDSWTELVYREKATLPSKVKVYIRAIGENLYVHNNLAYYYNGETNKGRFNIGGDITTLLNAEGNLEAIPYLAAFSQMFRNTKVVDASKLTLPSTTLTNNCYYAMFWGCSELVRAPKVLPATVLTRSCYDSMFRQCSKLEDGPEEICATTLAPICCDRMFSGCSELKAAPELYAQEPAEDCYFEMFDGCNKIDKLVMHLNSYTKSYPGPVTNIIPDRNRVTLYLTHKMREQMTDDDIMYYLEPKNLEYIDEPITMKEDPNNAGDFYTTLYNSDWAYHIPEGVKAYTATLTDKVIHLSAIKGNTIPKGEPVVIKCVNEEAKNTTDNTLYIPHTFKSVKKNRDNILKGTPGTMTAPANTYILSCEQNQLGFYKFTGTLEAHKAYLVSDSNTNESISIIFDDVPGDLNADGVISVSDLTLLIDILSGRATDTNGAADVDGKDGVTIDDIRILTEKILEK